MKKHLLLVIIALVAAVTPVLAQDGTIGLYFSQNGVQSSRYAQYSAFVYDAYVTIYVEDVVYGANFQLDVLSADVSLLQTVYPEGVQIGNILSGVEIGMTDPVYGFMGEPVVIAHCQFLNNVYPMVPNVDFMINPLNYTEPFPLYVGNDYLLNPLHGLPSALGDTIANEDMTWSGVKNLYQ